MASEERGLAENIVKTKVMAGTILNRSLVLNIRFRVRQLEQEFDYLGSRITCDSRCDS